MRKKCINMDKHVFAWVAVVPLLVGAGMLVADIGAAALWIAVITVGIALVAIDGYRHRGDRRQG